MDINSCLSYNLFLRNQNTKKFKDKKIVCIGGGTGLSVILKGLKEYTDNLTAIVTVADDGGGSGTLREELNILPPGDIRNCILALADSEPIMEELIGYRFSEGGLKGQSFGNLLLAAMTEVCKGDFVKAVREVSNVLKVKGTVLPVTESDVNLAALLENGMEVIGESEIGKSILYHGSKISKVWLENKDKSKREIKPLGETLEAIESADIITLGPGSLYTSIIPNLIVPGIKEAIKSAKAPVIFINNIMTQPGETDGYTAYDHYRAIADHTGGDLIDYCIMNNGETEKDILIKYIEDGAAEVIPDKERFEGSKTKVIEDNMVLITPKGTLRHKTSKIVDIIYDILKKQEIN